MPVKAYECGDGGFKFTEDMKTDFDRDGCILVKGLFSKAEVKHVEKAMTSGAVTDYNYGVSDGEGGEVETALWSHPGNDVTGMVSRCKRVVDTCEKLLGGEVYHYHSKTMMKPPHTGGQHLWHQDYGYWYKYGFLNPDMLTVFIAIDDCMKTNGCLQVLRGSHKVGRIDHGLTAGQLGVSELDRVQEIRKFCPLEYVEMEKGDVLFFHCNVLHSSSGNPSDHRRWAFISAYNKANNGLLHEETAKQKLGHGTRLEKVPDSALLECQNFDDVDGKDFVLVKTRPFPARKIGKCQQ